MHISHRSSGSAVLCSMIFGSLLVASAPTAAQAQLFKKSAAPTEFKKSTLVVNLQAQLGTANSRKGDVFTALVLAPSELVGSVVEGTVTRVVPAGASDQSHLVVQFNTISLPDNTTYKLKASFKDVVNAKGMARLDDEGHTVGTGAGKKGAGSASGLAFSEIGPALSGLAGSEAISLDISAQGTNMTFAPGTHFILDAENNGLDKTVSAYRVRQEAATEAAKSALQALPESNPAHAPSSALADGSDAHVRPGSGSPQL